MSDTDERMDYVAMKDGSAYALMSADHATARDVREFHQDHAGAEIKLMPTREAVKLHLKHLEKIGFPLVKQCI